jgi:hypothetical protein
VLTLSRQVEECKPLPMGARELLHDGGGGAVVRPYADRPALGVRAVAAAQGKAWRLLSATSSANEPQFLELNDIL